MCLCLYFYLPAASSASQLTLFTPPDFVCNNIPTVSRLGRISNLQSPNISQLFLTLDSNSSGISLLPSFSHNEPSFPISSHLHTRPHSSVPYCSSSFFLSSSSTSSKSQSQFLSRFGSKLPHYRHLHSSIPSPSPSLPLLPVFPTHPHSHEKALVRYSQSAPNPTLSCTPFPKLFCARRYNSVSDYSTRQLASLESTALSLSLAQARLLNRTAVLFSVWFAKAP